MNAKSAIVNGIVHFFGGLGGNQGREENMKKIAVLDGCKVKQLKVKLQNQYGAISSAVGFEAHEKSYALICFEDNDYSNYTYKKCESFDGSTVRQVQSTIFPHRSGCLGQFSRINSSSFSLSSLK